MNNSISYISNHSFKIEEIHCRREVNVVEWHLRNEHNISKKAQEFGISSNLDGIDQGPNLLLTRYSLHIPETL